MKKIPTLWHESYDQPSAATWLSTRKQKPVVQACAEAGLLDLLAPAEPDFEKIWADIARVHDSAYVQAVRTGEPRALAQSQEFTWSEGWAASVARIWHGHAAACDRALGGEAVVFHPVSGAHHAVRARGMGYCTFNYLVGAARAILDREAGAEKILVLDLDTHQGNGIRELVGDDRRILELDVSGADFGVKPFDDLARGSVYRLVRDADAYREAVALLPGMIGRHHPGLVLFQAGMDCFEADSLGDGVPGMNAERLAERDRFVFETCRNFHVPVVFNLAGGYTDDGTTVALHVQTARIASDVFGKETAA